MTTWSFQVDGISFWLALALCLGLLWLGWRHVRASGHRGRVLLLESLRLLAVICILVTLLRPERVQTYQRDRQPQVVVLVDNTASMTTVDMAAGDASAPSSRDAWVRQQLDDDFAAPLTGRYQVIVEEVASAELAATETNLNAALAALPDRFRDLQAVILLSDGDWNTGGSPVAAATQLAVGRVRIFPVAVGSHAFLPDLVLDQVRTPAYSLLGEHVSIPFRIQNRLAHEVRTELRLNAGGRIAASKPLVLPPGGTLQESILWKSETLGEHSLSLVLPVQPGEVNTANNEHTFRISVRQERIRVLVVDSLPRWEYRFLRNALSRDPGIDLDCLLLHPGLPPGDGPDYIQSFPGTRDRLGAYDVIFLGDVGIGENELTTEHAELLAGVVDQLGSGLVFLPGPRGRHFSLLDGPLGDLMPVVLDPAQPRGLASDRMATLELTTSGSGHLLTMLSTSPGANRRLWGQLPGFYWCAPVIRTRPGAEVLAVHGIMRNRWGRLPLLVTRPSGQGNVLFMGTDSAWRWRKGVEDTYHYRFWGQVVRWMAHPRHLAQEQGIRLVFTPERPHQGETIVLHASVADATGFPLTEGEVFADISTGERRHARVMLQPEPGGWGVYSGRFQPTAVGAHEITVSAPTAGRQVDARIDVAPHERERLGQPSNHALLEELARITDGTFATWHELPQIVQAVNLLPESEALQVRFLLWSQWWWGLFILLLLTAFWTFRKLAGLV